MAGQKKGSIIAGLFWMLIISILLFWIPTIGPLIAGFTADMHGINGAVYAFIVLAAAITLASLAIKEAGADFN